MLRTYSLTDVARLTATSKQHAFARQKAMKVPPCIAVTHVFKNGEEATRYLSPSASAAIRGVLELIPEDERNPEVPKE
jgi:hypothetical protein